MKEFLENKKKIILLIFCGIILLAIFISIILFFNNNDDKNKENDKKPEEKEENIEYTLLEEGIQFNCTIEEKSYSVYDDVNCEIKIELQDKFSDISEIDIGFDYDKEVEYLKNASTSLEYYIDAETTVEDKKINIKIKDSKQESKYSLKLNFNIDSSKSDRENLNIYFKNIVLKTKDGLYYKFNDNTIGLKIKVPKYKNDGLVFYKHDDIEDCYKEISRYNCEEKECGIFSSYGLSHVNYNDGKLIIFDGREKVTSDSNWYYYKNIVFYDLEKETNRKIQNISRISNGWWGENNYSCETFVLQNLNNEMAIVDNNGEYIKEFSSKKFNLNCYEGCSLKDYSTENDVIVTSIEGKYGIEKISSNDIIVDHIFEDINLTDSSSYDEKRYSNNKYFKAKENGKWYLYSYETKEKIMNNGYDNFYIVDEEIIVVYDDNKLWIKDYNGNNISKEFIELEYELYPLMPKNPEGIRIEKNDNIITIYFSDGNKLFGNFIPKTYEFNTENRELNRIK